MLWSSFIGPSYRARSLNIAQDALINLYPETTEIDAETKRTAYYGTPGLKLFLTASDSVCRGCWSQDGRTFVVFGPTLYEINITLATATNRGTVANDGKPVSFASNGRGGEQLGLVAGGKFYIYSFTANTLTLVAVPLTYAAVQVEFINGYFLLLEQATIRIWFSALENGLSWSALNFFSRSETSDNLVGMKVVRDRVWVFGSQTSEIYYNSGDPLIPFLPYPGSVMSEGAVTPWAITARGDTLYWLAQDNQGRNRFVSASNYAPVPISTPPISFALASYSTLDDVEVLAYEQEGHPFVVWTCPSGNQTWAYDVKERQWHERESWNSTLGIFARWRARGLCSSGTLLLTGDYATGALYTLDLDTFQDNGLVIRRLRRAPYLSAENQWLFLDRIELGIQSGIGLATGQGSAPQLMASVSRDSGATWTPVVTTTMGATGAASTRAVWRTLGRVRADRFGLEITQTDPVRTVWGPGLWLRTRAGSGQL